MKLKFTFLFILTCVAFYSQNKQPKVGLVLSGGGAKGFAHIGVLKEIDKAGIQLDYIGGTSMGAVIGGLYAVGYSADQIEEIVVKTNFYDLLRDVLPRSSETFFEKEYGEKTIITFPISKGKIEFPKGISKGQRVLNLLLELLNSNESNLDFTKLPIPFFCIATDIENGNPVILEKGSLPLAIRASSSIPSILNPVNINDKLLIDGGIANNFPVTIMKNKGMDIVIGVDVEGKLFQKEKINSLVSLLNQIISFQVYKNTNEEIKKIDVYIHPEIYNYSVVDFDKKIEILRKGDSVAKKFSKVFKNIANKQTVKKAKKNLAFPVKKIAVSKIEIEGSKNYTRAYVLGKLKIRVGDSLSKQDITQKIYLLSASRNYNKIEYDLVEQIDNSYLLKFKLEESNENANIKLGVHYDLLYKSGIIANYNQKHLLKNNDLFSADLIFGDNVRYNLNYFVDNGFYISYGFKSKYNHFTTNSIFNQSSNTTGVNKINLRYTDFTNQAFFQTTFNRKFALGFGLEQKWVKASTETLSSALNEVTILDKSNYYNIFGYLKLDTYNKRYFVTKGFFADLNYKWYLTSSDYNNNFKMFSQAKGTLGFATSFGERFTIQNTNEAGFTIGNPTSSIFDFYLGGYNQNYINTFVSLYGYEFGDLSGNSFVKSQVDLRYRIKEKNYITFIANYARLDDNVFNNLDLLKNVKSGYAVGYSYDSFLGPIELKFSWTPDIKKTQVLFNLGYWF